MNQLEIFCSDWNPQWPSPFFGEGRWFVEDDSISSQLVLSDAHGVMRWSIPLAQLEHKVPSAQQSFFVLERGPGERVHHSFIAIPILQQSSFSRLCATRFHATHDVLEKLQ